jgi:hypothetical protein
VKWNHTRKQEREVQGETKTSPRTTNQDKTKPKRRSKGKTMAGTHDKVGRATEEMGTRKKRTANEREIVGRKEKKVYQERRLGEARRECDVVGVWRSGFAEKMPWDENASVMMSF